MANFGKPRPPHAVSLGLTHYEGADEAMQLEWRVLKSIYGEVLDNFVLFSGATPFAAQEERERIKTWCRDQGVSSKDYRITPKRSIYFRHRQDAMLCILSFA